METVNHKELLSTWLNTEARRLPYNSASHVSGATVVHVADNTTHPFPPAPAWYEPNTGDAYIHLDAAGIDLKLAVSNSENKDRMTAHGLLAHEVAHSRWSRWLLSRETIESMTDAQHKVAVMFEEMRVEYRAVNSKTDLRQSLRASLGIIIRGAESGDLPTDRYGVAKMWALIFGRSITTVVDEDEVRWVDNAARTILGDDDVDYLTDLLQEAIEVRIDNAPRMIELAQEWLNVVGEPEHADEGCGCSSGKGDGDEKGEPGGSKNEKGDKSGDTATKGEGDDESEGDDLSSSAGVFNSVESEGKTDDGKEYSRPVEADEAEMVKNMLDRALDEIEENWDDTVVVMANPEEMAKLIFGKKRSARVKGFAPTAYHQRHVAETAKVLENFSIPAITKVSVATELPPGRLRSREAIRASAERAQGRMVTARPWEATKRRHTHTRPIVVGIATDTSSSMRWAETAVADFAYTWANAGLRVGARTAAITFGSYVLNISSPGEVMGEVRRAAADGGTEEADKALAAMDGGLKLSHQNGAAKLLVVVSDGHLVIKHEGVRVEKRLKEFRTGGTKVLWVTPSNNTFTQRLKRLGLADVVLVDKIRMYDYSDDRGKTFDAIQKAVLDKLRTMSNNN